MEATVMSRVEERTKPVVPPPPITQEPPLASVAMATPNDVVKPPLHDTTTTPTPTPLTTVDIPMQSKLLFK